AFAGAPDGTRVATLEGDTPRRRDWDSGPEEKPKADDPPRDLEVWDTRTGKRLLRLKVKGPVVELSLSPDGKRLAALQRTVTVWETASGKECSSFDPVGSLLAIAFTHDGNALPVFQSDPIHLSDPP